MPIASSPASSSTCETNAAGLSRRCCARVEPVRVDNLVSRFGDLPGGRYGVTPQAAVVFPLFRDEKDRYGFVVFGLSPWRAASDQYLGFLGLIATQLVSAIARARASEEERRRAEAMAELDRAKTLFFSNISHELRTPLTLMLGPTADALLSPSRTLEGQDLEVVHRNALRLQKLVGNLLDFARIEAGRARASFEAVRLDVLTKDLASTFESAMRDAGLVYEVRLRRAFRAAPDRSEHVGEDRAEPDLQRLEVHASKGAWGSRSLPAAATSSSRWRTRALESPSTS